MTDDTPTQSSDQLDQIIAEYLAAEESGAAPPPEDVVAANPELAEELQQFFANREGLAVALPNEPPRKRFVPPKVRYFGDYELIDEIARGGMGVVYRARQTSLNRIVAIKMILSGHLAGEEDVKRFHTEAEAAGRLKHPGIVPVHEVGVHEGHHYFSMDYIEGRSLAAIVRENPLPVRKAAEYVRSIADAVQSAHQQGTLHRDLKPSNVLVDGKDHIHITDFGLAVRVDGDSELTRTGQVLGTPAYMPPEQAEGKRGLIGPGSDVYALGAILYELLTSRPPFRGESAIETLKLVIEGEPVSPRLLNPKVPRDLETICLKCLQKEPHKRYLTAEELAEELQRFLSGEPIKARPVGRLERAWRWCRRKPAAAGLLASILLLIVGAIAGALWYVNDRGQQRLAELKRAAEESQRLAVEEAEEASRLKLVEQRIGNALEIAESHRAQALTLTDRPTEWGAVLDSARAEYRQAAAEVAREGENIVAELRRRVEQLGRELDADEQDLQLAVRYEEIRLELVDMAFGDDRDFRPKDVIPKLREALASLEIHIGQTPANSVAEHILNRPPTVRETWITLFDDCLARVGFTEPDLSDWLLAVLRAADPGPWRDEVRRTFVTRNVDDIKRLAADAEADLDNHPTSLLIILAQLLATGFDEEGASLLTRLQSVRPNDFWVNFEAARSLRDLGQFEQAMRYYYAALAIRPNDASVRMEVGAAFFELNDLEGAEAMASHALTIDPAYAAAQTNLGNVFWRRGELEQAIALYRLAIESQPDLAAAHANLGIVLKRLGDLEAADDCLRTAIAIDSRNSYWYASLGEVLQKLGYLPGAIFAYEQAARLDPENSAAQFHVAVLRRYTGDVPGYQAACRTMVERFSGSSDWRDHALLLEALLLFPEGARPELLELARRNAADGDPNRFWLLPLAYYRQNDNFEALELPKQSAIEEMDNHPRICYYLSLALLQLQSGRLKDARTSIREARRIQETYCDESCAWPPWNPERYLWREVYEEMKAAELTERLPDLPPTHAEFLPFVVDRSQQDVAREPESAPAAVQLGYAFILSDDIGAAIDAFQEATRVDPEHARAWARFGDACLRRSADGDEEQAIDAFRKVVELQPGSPGAHADLGRALHQAGALNNAIAAYERAYELYPRNETLQTQFVVTCLDAGEPETAIAAVRRRLDAERAHYNDHFFLASLLRYIGDEAGYREACRRMFDEFSAVGELASRHALVFTWLFFPESGEPPPELLEVARVNAEQGHAIHKRMLGLAYYRLGHDAQALPVLQEAATAELGPNRKIVSLLCLALAQLRTEDLEAARTSIREAFDVQRNSPGLDDSKNRQAWGELPSLWREVHDAMTDKELDEPIPELPPKYEEWLKLTPAAVGDREGD